MCLPRDPVPAPLVIPRLKIYTYGGSAKERWASLQCTSMPTSPCRLTLEQWPKGLGQVALSWSDLPLASASSDMIRWSRVLLSNILDRARSY